MDNMDSVEFIAPFEPDEISFRNAFVPMSFPDVDITVGGSVLFSGTMVSPMTNSTADSTTVAASCYARCGVLQDCSMPSSSYPIEWRKQNIKQIAEKMLEPFGLGVIFDADPGPVFDKVAAKPDQSVYRFLAGLAKQRALIMSNTPQGNLLFWQSVQTGNPVVSLESGQTPLIGVRSVYNAQQYYSHITGLKQRKVGSKGSKFTVANPHIGPVLRPMTFTINDGKKADPKISTNAEMGRMFARCVSYRISLDTWRDPNGNLWEPNTTLILEDHSNMIYSPYEFLIRNVVFDKTPNSETAQLTLVLPGCFSGEVPETLPWQT
jgi:prophage tail gpP-like protein